MQPDTEATQFALPARPFEPAPQLVTFLKRGQEERFAVSAMKSITGLQVS